MPEPNTEFENKLAASDFGKMVQLPPITIPGSTKAPADMSVDELSASMRGQASLFLDKAANPYTPQLISPLQIDQTGRYNKQLVGWDNEDLYGSMQSNWDKAANGVLKGLELAGTTFLQGTVGLVAGLGNVITGNGMSSFYNNDFSQLMDEWNKKAEIALPNYYTAKETNAEWYSPDNLFTANFIFDKLIKNAGFSLGALASGGAVSKVLSGTMKAVGLLSEAKQAAQLVTALDEALPAIPQAARAAKFQELLSQAIPKMTAKGVDRTVTSLFGAATEGGIEAMQGLNEFRDQKIAEFQNLNGRIPNDQEMKLINEEASSLGNSRFFMNVGLLSATNYIQLPRILGSRYSTSKAIANTEAAARGEVGGIRRTAEGAFERALPTSKFGKAFGTARGVAGTVFSGSEAFEEGAQFVIQEGTKDYYNKKYGGEGASFLDSLYKGASELNSKEGMESVLLGGLSGGIQQSYGNLTQRGITGTGGKQGAATEKLVGALNATNSMKWFADMKDAAARGINIMQEQQAHIRQGDVLAAKDSEADLMHNYLAVRIKNGRYDLVKEDIAAFRQQSSTQPGLDKLKQDGYANEIDTIETFNARLTNFEKHADNLKTTFEALNLRYGGIFTPDGKRVYDEKVIDQMAYAVSKIADYDQRIPELSKELLANGIDVQGAIDKTEGVEDPFAQIQKLEADKIINVDQAADLKTALTDVLQMTKRRQAFLEEYNTIAKDPTGYQEVPETPTASTQSNTVKIKTKDGEEDIEIGVEYYLGNTTYKDKNGFDTYHFPTLTVLGENADGTIKIKDGKGEIRDVSKDVLASYKLGKVSDTQNNKKAKFYFDHINDVFEFNFGKGKKQKGRLQFSQKDGILLFTYKNQWGKVKSIEVTGDQFVPKKGFDTPMITKVGTLTAAQQKSLEDYAAEADERKNAKRTSRLAILQSLVDDTGKRIDSVQDMLQKKYSEFERITEELSRLEQKIKAGELTKKNNFKATTNRALKAANKLSRLQESIKLEIQALEAEKDELEFNLEYFVDAASNIDELPTDSQDFIEELNDQVLDLGILIEETGKSITKMMDLSQKVENALETAIEWLRENIRLFQNVYPKAPLSLDNQEFNAFLEANPNFLKKQPDYIKDLRELEDMVSQVEDLDIKPNERTLNELNTEIEKMLEDIKELEKIYKAKEAIVNKFIQIAEEAKAQKKAEAEILANKAMMDKFFHQAKKAEQSSGTATSSPEEQEEAETNSAKERQEARKPISVLFNSTTTPSVITRESDKRHQRFLAKFPLLPNTLNIRIQFVTKNNEAAFGLTGIIDKQLGADAERFRDTAILAIYLEKDGNITYFIDENGKRVGKVEATSAANQDELVYALMPTTSLEDSEGTRYQTNNTTPEQAAVWQEAWEAKRTEILSYKNNSPIIEEINISRGIPTFSDETEYISGTLVTEAQLDAAKPLIVVSTKGTIEHQGRTVNIPKGRVLVQNGSILEYANNRNFNDQEAVTLFNVIKAFVAKANASGTFDTNLMTYLHGVIKFDSPYKKVDDEVIKNKIARNQMYFHKGNLYFGEKEYAVPFTEASVEAHKAEILGFLKGAYNHVNVKLLEGNKPFNELNADLSIKKEWPTYQHYLLSSEGRTKEEVPLSTKIRPIDPSIPNDRNFNNKYAYFNLIKVEEEVPPVIEEEEEEEEDEKPLTAKEKEDKEFKEILEIARANAEELSATKAPTPSFLSKLKNTEDTGSIGQVEYTLEDLFGGATEPTEVSKPKDTGTSMADLRKKFDTDDLEAPPDSNFRVVGAYNYALANVEEEKAYIEANSPFSVQTIKNLIAAGNGIFAWGAYQNALITLSEKMEEGTGYHELFEGIYDVFLNKAEKQRIYKEFASRKGTFIDRETGKTIEYKNATVKQAKEEMAEEFRSFKLYETLPSHIQAESALAEFFRNLFNWIKSIFTGEIKSLDNLFSRMDSAFYKNVPFKNTPSTEINFRIGTFNALDTDAVIKGVVSSVFQEIYKEGNTKLINELDFGGQIPLEIYDKINKNLRYYYLKSLDKDGKVLPKTAYADLLAQGMDPKDIDNLLLPIANSLFENWGEVVAASGEMLKTFKILQEQDNDKEDEDRENTSRDENYLADAFQWDGKKNAPASIKLLIATLQESIFVATGAPVIGEQPLRDIEPIRDASTRMQKMVDYAKTFNALLDQLSTENSLLEKEKKIRQLADSVPEYVRIFTRLRIEKGQMSVQDWALRIKFYNTFAKQKPIALNTYINEDGTTSIGAADLDNAVKQLSTDWIAGLKALPNVSYKDDRYILNTEAKNKQGIYIIPHDTTGPSQRLKYLAALGIKFSAEQVANMTKADKEELGKAVSSLRVRLVGEADITSLYKLQVKGPIGDIFKIFLKTQNLVPASVFSDLQGNYRQTFVQTNAVSRMANDINASSTRDALLQELPHLGQEYSKDSDYVNNILFGEEGENLHKDLLIKYIQGIVTRDGDKNVPTEKLSKAKKLMQAINQNLNENYYLLIPADSQTEWMIGLKNKYLGLTDAAMEQFFAYYENEQALGGSEKRLFTFLAKKDKNGKEIALNRKEFDREFSKFVLNEAAQQFQELTDFNIIQSKSNGKYEWTGLDKKYAEVNNLSHKNLSLEQVEQIIMERTVNFIYNNVEIQKMFFGDPAAYTKATRRYKSFLSPREQSLYDTPEFDAQANKEYHTIAGVKLKAGDPGYLLYRNSLKTISTSDVFSFNDIPGYEGTTKKNSINGSDGQGVATLVAYKQMRIKNGFRWSTKDEDNFQYLAAQDRLLMAKDGLYKYKDKALREHDEALEKPKETSRFSPLKPIVSGFNEGGPILDKYSIAAITYAAVRGTNWALQYKRMLDNQVGYIIYESGRKVGVKGTDSIYSTEPYKESAIEEVPFKWFGIQVETGGDEKSQTWGSQTGKLNTVNLLNAGLPIDYAGDYDEWYNLSEEEKLKASPIYTLVAKEKSIRTAMIENGYQQLLEKVGINKDGTVSKKKLLALIKDELTRRELNDNIKQALKMEGDDFAIPLEALNNYEQIKSIIFSYVTKYISAPKVSGGAKIQVSGSGWEVAGERVVKNKNKDGQTIYTAAGLKFYTKEEPWMEVMLPNWFAKKIRQIPSLRDLTNEELIHYINNSPESKELLSGIGFRIPTQELNSIENFRVKAFLPEEFGDMIVVPEALTKKSGGDFDVDKLNTYLKNVYINKIGELAVVPYFGQGEEAIEKFRDIAATSPETILELSGIDKLKGALAVYNQEDYAKETYTEEEIEEFNRIIKEDITAQESYAQKLYKQSLENEYFRTLDQILSLPQNFDRLIAPNNSKELEDLRDILEIISEKEFGQGAIKSILSPTYMNTLRHMYISGKSNVGIAASAQTQNAVSQKTAIVIDPSKKSLLKESNEIDYIGDATVKLPSNSIKIKGKTYQTISLAKDRVGRYISDKISQFINGFVDIAADPFLVQIGVTRDNAGTFMFLERMGVPTDTTVYFMNQPIIREYTKMLEKSGRTYPYISKNVDLIKQQFPTKSEIPSQFPTKGLETLLKTNINQFYNDSLTQEENAFQHFILDEYLKYSVMASNLFRLSQATNYDTAKFSDPWLYFRKVLKTRDAETNNIFSSAKDSLQNTFVGPIASRVGSAVMKISNSFFKFLNEGINPYIFPVMENLANRKKMSDADFQKAARKVEQSFINFLSQISSGLNERIKDLLIDEETSAARLLEQMKAKMENMRGNPFKILSSFITEDKDSPTSTKTIKIFNKGTTAYEQNTFIAAMEELQNNPAMKELYGKLARVAFLQSGVAKSPISFTEFLPVETFKAFIMPAIKELTNPELMKAFVKTGTFYKNNWKDPNIVPKMDLVFDFVMNRQGGDDEVLAKKHIYESESLNLYAKKKGNTNFKTLKLSTKSGNISADYLTATIGKGKDRKTWLMRKLIDPSTGEPFIVGKGDFLNVVYYSVNPLGDGYKGQEHYSNIRQSVFNNEGVKQESELSPEEVLRAIKGEINVPLTNNVLSLPMQTQREYTPENITSLKPNEVFVFGANTAGGHGGGTAGIAQRGIAASNYTALPIGTKGKWSEYGVVDKLMQGTEGKSFGIVTKAASISGNKLSIGAKRSVSLERIETSVRALIESAKQNPDLKYLVTKFGTNMAGFNVGEMKAILNKYTNTLPDNIILPKEFEVRTTKQSAPTEEDFEAFKNSLKRKDCQ